MGHRAKQDYSGILKSCVIYLAWFGALAAFFSFQFLPFGTEISILCLSHHRILEAHQLSRFTDSQLENFPADESYLEPHIWFKYFDETLDLRYDTGMSQEFGAIGMKWTCFACEKDMNWGEGQNPMAYIVFHHNSYIEALHFNVMVFGDRAFRRHLR